MLSQSDHDLAQIEAAVRRGDQRLAADLAVATLGRGVRDPLVLLLVAERLETEGRGQEALGLLKEATTAVPDEPKSWRRFGELLARQGMLADAVEAFDAALAINSDDYLALIAAGAASYQRGEFKSADSYYRRAADLKPEEPELLSTLALIAARRAQPKEARALAERALIISPTSITAQMALGRADLLEGLADVAEARMTRLIGRQDLSNQVRVNVLDLRAEALDVLDRPADAFGDYEARNRILEAISAPVIQREMKSVESIRRGA